MINPFFSVIVPIFNMEGYMDKCMISLLKQTFKNFEIILIDDGSIDKSGSICDAYQKQYPEIIRTMHTLNKGVSSARNKGIELAKGKFIAFVDCDDIVDSNYLELFYQLLKQSENIDLAICGVMVNGKSVILHGEQSHNGVFRNTTFYEEVIKRNSFRGYLVNKVFRLSILQEHQIFLCEDAHMCEDLLFCCEYAKYIKFYSFENTSTYNYVQRSDSAVHQKFNKQRISVLNTYEKIIGIVSQYGSRDATHMAKTNYLIHNSNIYMMVYKRKEFVKVKARTGCYVREKIHYIWNKDVEFKTIIKVVYTYLLTYGRK